MLFSYCPFSVLVKLCVFQSQSIIHISQDTIPFRLVCRKKTEEDPLTEVTEVTPKIANINKAEHLAITDTLITYNTDNALNV